VGFLVWVNQLTLQAGLPAGKDARSHRATARVGGVEVVNCVDEIRVSSTWPGDMGVLNCVRVGE